MTTTNTLPEGWGTESGLLDDEDVTITEAIFNYNAKYGDGNLVLTMTMVTDDGAEYETIVSVGKNFEATDRGKRAVREDGSNKLFQRQSKYAQWYTKAGELAGEALTSRGSVKEADIWVGTRWHVERVKVNYGGEIGEKDVLLPTAFLGLAEAENNGTNGTNGKATASAKPETATKAAANDRVAAAKERAAAKAAAVAAAAQANPSSDADAGDDDPVLLALRQAAIQSADFDAFIQAAYEIDGLEGSAFEAHAQDEDWYADNHG